MASVIAEVRGAILLRTRKMPLFELTVGQGRHALKCIWFHATHLEGKFHAGQTVALYGKVEPSRLHQQLQDDPASIRGPARLRVTTPRHASRGWPHYAGLRIPRREPPLASRWQRKVIFHLLESVRGAVPECLPQEMLAPPRSPPSREAALCEAHFPPEGTSLTQLQSAATPSHRRLIFEELFFLELGLELQAPAHARASGRQFCYE